MGLFSKNKRIKCKDLPLSPDKIIEALNRWANISHAVVKNVTKGDKTANDVFLIAVNNKDISNARIWVFGSEFVISDPNFANNNSNPRFVDFNFTSFDKNNNKVINTYNVFYVNLFDYSDREIYRMIKDDVKAILAL